MTFEQWIQNPAGLKTAVMTNRQMYRDFYTSKFDKIMLREGNNFRYFCYKTANDYIIHIKVPSEVIPKFYYDVVIFFYTNNAPTVTNSTLKNYDVKFYTNSPDFVYTHCHAYVVGDLFFTGLSKKMNKLSLTKTAIERNPKDDIGYVKSIFFAYLIMQRKQLFEKSIYVDKYSEKYLLSTVSHADDVVQARQEVEVRLREQERREKKEQKKAEREAMRPKLHSSRSTMGVKQTVTSSKVKTVSNTRKVKKI